ncbi:21664_t:CDS:2 [Gigaspora rosea]|nr:21664_t:CDS:2 [Gigaspora rosea]
MTGWKYSFERLSKHKYIACIIHPKKVVCICGKTIKLNRKWKEDYLNHHVQHSGYKANKGQRTIYNRFQPVEQKEHYRKEEYNKEIKYDSDSVEISKYIKRTTAQFGGCHRIEIVARELFSHLFAQKFSRKKLNFKQKRQLNCALFAESVWQIDRSKKSWIILADKALKDAFNDAPIFTGLCEVMSDAIEQKMKNKSNKNLKYSEEFTNFLVILGGISSRALDIFRQNLEAKFKRLLDTINYNGPIAAMTDNTKLKLGLRYSSNLGSEDRIAKSVLIALILNNGSDTADSILQLHKQLIIEIVPLLGLHILSLESNGAITKFQAQQSISKIQTNEKLIVKEPDLNINFSCSIFDNIGPVIRIQDPKHAKKTARNAIMSGARLLTYSNSSAQYDHLLQLINQQDSVMFKK